MLKVIIFAVLLIGGRVYAHDDDDEDHSLHCHHDDDDTIHLHIGESQTLKGTCILLTCLDHETDTFKETRCPEKPPGSWIVIPGQIGLDYPDCCDKYIPKIY